MLCLKVGRKRLLHWPWTRLDGIQHSWWLDSHTSIRHEEKSIRQHRRLACAHDTSHAQRHCAKELPGAAYKQWAGYSSFCSRFRRHTRRNHGRHSENKTVAANSQVWQCSISDVWGGHQVYARDSATEMCTCILASFGQWAIFIWLVFFFLLKKQNQLVLF